MSRQRLRGWPLVLPVLVGLFLGTAAPGAGAGTDGILGRVTDWNGEALDGARVTAARLGSDAPVRSAETELSGGFLLSGLAPGHYEVRAGAEGYREERVEIVLTEEGRARVFFRLRLR